jgi:hypothetical protein
VEPGNIIIDFGRKIVLPKAKFRSLEEDLYIPIDNRGRMIINFPGPSYSSFMDLSASKLIEPDDFPEEESFIPAPAGIALIGDVSTRAGKSGPGVFGETAYPDNLILASALNTVLTENFLRPAGIPETILLFLPAIVLLSLFLALASGRDLKFFAIGLPAVYLVIILLSFGIGLCMFLFRTLPNVFPVLAGLPITLFLLVGMHLFSLENERTHGEQETEEEMERARMGSSAGTGDNAEKPMNINRTPLPDEQELRSRLSKYGITDEPQVLLSLDLLVLDLVLKEVAYKHGIRTDDPVNTLQSRARKIYRRCGVHTRNAFFTKIMNTID